MIEKESTRKSSTMHNAIKSCALVLLMLVAASDACDFKQDTFGNGTVLRGREFCVDTVKCCANCDSTPTCVGANWYNYFCTLLTTLTNTITMQNHIFVRFIPTAKPSTALPSTALPSTVWE